MSDEPTVGRMPHRRMEGLPDEKRTVCVRCDQLAVGHDARLHEPVCPACGRRPTIPRPDDPADHRECPPAADAWFTGPTSPLVEFNAFRRDALAAVALYKPDGRHDRPYDLGIKNALKGFYNRRVHNTQVYPALSDLVEAELLHTDPGNQRTNYYGFTERGRTALAVRARFLLDAAVAAGGISHHLRVLAETVPGQHDTQQHPLDREASSEGTRSTIRNQEGRR